MKRLRVVVLILGVLALTLLAWNVLRAPYPQATWLSVEAPAVAVMNRPLQLRITLPSPSDAGMLMADLHGSADRHEPMGYLNHSSPHLVTPEGGVFTFDIPIPVRPDLKHVRAIIYLGPTERWADRLKVVATDEIPVKPTGASKTATSWKNLQAHESVPDPEIRFHEAAWARPLIAALWVLAGLLAARGELLRVTHSEAIPQRISGRRFGLALALACLAAAVFEISGVELNLAAQLRAYAQDNRLYHDRRWLQQGATLLALGGSATLGWVALWRTHSPARSLALLGLGLFAAFSAARLFSLHEVDQILARQMGPLSLAQFAQLASVLIVVIALWPRKSSEPGPSAPGLPKDS